MKSKLLKKIVTLTIIGTTLLTALPIGASAEWRSDNVGWWYSQGTSYPIGWKLIDHNWYYFNSNSYMAHNTMVDGYYIDSSGVAVATENVGLPIKIPASWIKMDNKKADVDSGYIISDKSAFIYKTMDTYGCSESLFMSGMKAGLANNQSNIDVSEKYYNGKKGICVQYEFTEDSKAFKAYIVFFMSNNKAHGLGVVSLLDGFDNDKQKLEDLLNLSLAI